MNKRKAIEKLGKIIAEKENSTLKDILPTFFIVDSDNSVNLSDKAIKLLGGKPEEYEDVVGIEGLEHKLVANKKAYLSDTTLFTPEGNYRAYPDFKVTFISFYRT